MTCMGDELRYSYIRPFTPSPSPRAITHGLRGQQVKLNRCRCNIYAFLVGTPRYGKASAFGFKVFPFVVQAQTLSNSLQSESNRKQ